MRRFAQTLPALVCILLLAACSTFQTKPRPEITYAHKSPIALNVRSLVVQSSYQAPGQPPNVEHRFATPPAAIVERWGHERLRTIGTAGTALFTVLSAPVTAQPLPVTKGFVGAFRIEPEEKLTITLEAQLEILDDGGNRVRLASTRVTKSREMEEGLTADERQLFWTELTKLAMDSFDTEMERAIQQYLSEWVL